jgi:deoxycytidine triphosphate deaminase
MNSILNRNFISTDKLVSINSYGENFVVGETVLHNDTEVGEATIQSFEIDEKYNEVKVYTNKGYAHIDFLKKK